MAKIHEILDNVFEVFLKNKDQAIVKYFNKEDGEYSSPFPQNILLKPIKTFEEIGTDIFIKWKHEDEDIKNKLNKGFDNYINNNYRASIVKYSNNNIINSFVMLPVIPHEGNTLEEKIKMLSHIIIFMKKIGIKHKLKICILASTRKEWLKGDKSVERMFREAEILEHNLMINNNINAEIEFVNRYTHNDMEFDLGFEVEETVKYCDILMPFNGSAGNSFVRFFKFLGGSDCEMLSIPWFRYDEVYPIGEGSFRKNNDLTNHIKSATVWTCCRKNIVMST